MTDPVAEIMQTNYEAAKRGALAMWTIYDRPADYPDGFIARMHEVTGGPTDRKHTGTLEELREIFRKAGLIRLAREPEDEPQIVETWM